MRRLGAHDPTEHLVALAARNPSAPAFLAPGRAPMNFGELARRIQEARAQLAGWGIGRGDVVVWPAIGRAETAAAIAILPASATLAVLAPALTEEAFHALLVRLAPKAVVTPANGDHPIARAALRLDLARIALYPDAAGPAGAFDLALACPGTTLERAATLSEQYALITVTSGTTGRAKIVPHAGARIMVTARTVGERLAIGPGDIAGHLTPLYLANGIRSAYLLCLLGGGAINLLPEADPDAFLAAVERGEVTYTSASFTIQRELLRRLESGRRVAPGRLRFVRVASGRMEPDEMDRLEAAFGIPVITGLASTETGALAQQGVPPALRIRGSVGPPVGCEIRVVDEHGRSVASGETGEIQVRGPQVFDGYIDDPELTARSFVDSWFRMGDVGRFDERGDLHLVGRLKELINRGGEKISPVEIDAALRSIPGIADAAAFGIPHSRLGEEVVAAIVREPDCALAKDQVIAQARAKLGVKRAPRRLWFVEALPRNAAGKLLRRSLPEWVGHDSTKLPAPANAPMASLRTPLEIALGGLWASALDLAQIGPDDDFFVLGGDSLRGAQLLDQVHAVFGVELSPDALFDDAGSVAGMARRIEAERARGAQRTGAPTIPRREPSSVVPLSHGQSRLWFLQRLDPGSLAYHESRLWRIDGSVDADALRAALEAVAVRQPMLRTRFPTVQGVPCQVIDDKPVIELEIVELSGAAADEEQRLAEAVRERAMLPFELAAATPIRWSLFELGPGRHALLRVWHHILCDALSARVLNDDLSKAYAAVAIGRAAALPPLPVEFADYSVWQARELAGPGAARALDYWKKHLADLPTLALPTDFRRPATQSFRGAVVTAQLGREVVSAMTSIGREQGATTFVTFLTAFTALLSRLSGDEDLAIGTPVAGRTLPELAEVIGFFANTLVYRADFSGAPSVVEALRRARDRVREALEHQEMPFEKLVDALGVPRDPSRNPLFQVAFGMRKRDPGDLAIAGAAVRRVETDLGRAKFDLTVTLLEGPDGGMDARWEYCTDLFERATIERMTRQFATLIDAMVREPDRRIATLPLMDDATRERIVGAACGSTTAYPADLTIHRRFSAQAAANPAAAAIESLDYAHLDAAANRLAAELRAQGVAAGAFVAVACARAQDIATAWLAVLKAGAAYLPIDPDLPGERIAYIFDNARVTHLVADELLAGCLARTGMTTVCPDRDAARIAAHAADAPVDATPPDAAAYAIYTSGSAGSPKGVVVPHRAVLRLVCGTDYAQLGPGDAVAQMANPAFDASTFEFWGALLNGARIVPVAKTTAIAPRALAAAIASQRMTALFLTTALFNAIAREAPDAFRPCRTVLFGGEAVEPRWVADVLRAGPPRHLLHVYGPTEATTFATWHEVRSVPPDATTIPIGKAIANTEVFVLRSDLEPSAPGEPGEICIGGPGLALGYLGGPELSAERFVETRVGPLPPRRLYRTGDRARLRDDGAIEFLGRLDRQVKVRGHRIELDEIQAAIARVPAVREAIVTLRGDTTDTRQIVAYVVPADPTAPPPANLWRDLRPVLPDYMLPAAIVWLPALPLNASGKVDHRALPAVSDASTRRPGVPVAPRDMFEHLLVRIWEDLLGVKDVGVFDHFFEIGGHSLLAARLVDQIERETGLAVHLTALFTNDTVAGLAQALREGVPESGAPILAINDGGTLPPFVFLHGDFTGGGFYSRALAHALGPDQPVLIVHPHGLVDTVIPPTIEAMAADRILALRALRPHGPYIIGGHCNGAFVAFEMARLLIEQGDQIPAVIIVEARAPRDPGEPAGDAREAYVRFDRTGAPDILAPRDRLSDAQLRYTRAMDRYTGRPCAAHMVIIRSRRNENAQHDLGWSRLAASGERHILPGGHVTLITRHVGELAKVVREAIDRALERSNR